MRAEASRRALRGIVGRALMLGDAARIDEDRFLLSALAQLEEAHLRALAEMHLAIGRMSPTDGRGVPITRSVATRDIVETTIFTANAAWAVLATLAHNLWRWTALLGGLAPGPVVAKTLRRRYLTLPGRITRSARRLTLHLPTAWPWRDAFVEALSRLRRVTIPQPC